MDFIGNQELAEWAHKYAKRSIPKPIDATASLSVVHSSERLFFVSWSGRMYCAMGRTADDAGSAVYSAIGVQ